MARIGGIRRKKSGIFTKGSRQKGKISQRAYLQTFENGEKVALKLEPGIQKGAYFPRFHGKSGEIIKKEGECYYVSIKDGNKAKQVIVHPIHLKKL